MSVMPTRKNTQQPPLNMPAPIPQRADPREVPQAVQQHLAAWHQMHDENVQLKQALQEANSEIGIAREALREKDLAVDFERQRVLEADRLKEKYLRFAQELLTRLQSARTTGAQFLQQVDEAMARAMEVAQNHEPTRPAIARFEEEVKRAVEAAAMPGDHGEPMPTDTADAKAD